MTERWYGYISDSIGSAGGRAAAAYETWTYTAPFLHRIRTRLRPGSRILELGCGAGFHAVLLASWGFNVVGIDSDERIVGLARETNTALGGPNASFRVADALDLPEDLGDFDLAFSLGLIEHFDRHTAVGMLRAQGRLARDVIAVIPTKHLHLATEPTDERLYDARGLASLCRYAGLRVQEVFAFGDLPTTAATWTRRLLPHGAYRLAQVHLGYAMELGVIATAKGD